MSISEEQFGFVRGKYITDAIVAIKQVQERVARYAGSQRSSSVCRSG